VRSKVNAMTQSDGEAPLANDILRGAEQIAASLATAISADEFTGSFKTRACPYSGSGEPFARGNQP
jgi:hypothetical protein